jgi:hypothetical protein
MCCPVTIRIWNAYACNNSSAYRVVARFADATTAAQVAADLRELLDVPDDAIRDYPPTVATLDEVLVVYHDYCLGLGDVGEYIAACGPRVVEPPAFSAPPVSVLFAYTSGALDAGLDELAAQLPLRDPRTPIATPWHPEGRTYGELAMFRDAGAVGLYVSIAPEHLAELRAWLAAGGVTAPSIRICEYADAARFEAIAAARCSACAGPVEYLDPRLHDIETAQLLCRPCGGFYDPAAFAIP